MRFDIPADTVATPAPPAPGQTRGLVSVIGKKLLSVLVFRALEAAAQVLAQALAQDWENSTDHRVCAGSPDLATAPPSPPLTVRRGTC